MTGRTPPSYYSFTAAGWRIISLNSQISVGSRSRQVRWLRERVRRPSTCRIAFFHRPRYSAGSHGDNRDMAAVWGALRGRARIALGGHDHNMQRHRSRNGIVQFVSGAGGRGLYRLNRQDRRLAFANDTRHGALRIRLRPGVASLAFVTAGGRVLDRSTLRCRP